MDNKKQEFIDSVKNLSDDTKFMTLITLLYEIRELLIKKK